MAITTGLLGVKPEYDGLRIAPCIPSDWPGFTFTRRFRGATYEIEVKNPDHRCKGISYLLVDGQSITGNLIPAAALGSTIMVSATLA